MSVGRDPVARFRADLRALLPDEGARVGIACSGGPDSTALLLLGARAFPGQVEAATVDHGLRPEARREALVAAGAAARLGIDHVTLAGDGPLATGGNVQARARSFRYRLLDAWARERRLAAILTAHHRDDQAETILMRLGRGAGLAGLSGIRPVRIDPEGGAPVLRPLLGWSRLELAQLVDEEGFVTVNDPSNRDERHDRTHMRALLATHGDRLPVARLAASAAYLHEADAAIDAAAEQAFGGASWDGRGRLVVPGCATLPRAIRRRLISRAIAAVRQRDGLATPAPDADVESLLIALEGGGSGTLGRVKASGGAAWRFEAVAPHRR